MTQMLVAVLMCTLVASLLVLRRGRTDHNITYASAAIAIAMTLNVDVVYEVADALMGASNVGTYVSDCLLMIGLFFLGKATLKAGESQPKTIRAAVGFPTLIFAVTASLTCFLVIDRGPTTTIFMVTLGNQLAAAIYSITVFTYCGVVVAAMLALAVGEFRRTAGTQRLPPGLLTLGCVFAIGLCTLVIIMDIAHVSGNAKFMRVVDPLYAPLTLLTFFFLGMGFASQPVARFAQERARRVQTEKHLYALDSLWHRATQARPSLSTSYRSPPHAQDVEDRLHRKVVEIRDAMIDARASFNVTQPELALIEDAEAHLLGCNTEGQCGAGITDHKRKFKVQP